MDINTGLSTFGTRNLRNTISAKAIMDMMTFRYAPNLHKVDCRKYVKRALPFLSDNRRSSILHISGEFSINPLLILTNVLIEEEKNRPYSTRSDKDFSKDLKRFANDLSLNYQEGHLSNDNPRSSPLEYSLRKTFSDDDDILSTFLYTYQAIKEKYGIQLITSSKSLKRDATEEIILDFPFSKDECWTISG